MTDDVEDEDLEADEPIEDEESHDGHTAKTFLAGLAIGALVGAGAAMLFAPQSGADTRRAVSRRARRLAREARDRYDDLRVKARRARRDREDRDDASDD